jgi:CHAT domain
MVHFATHGVLAGQLDGTHEPGLILTPPNKASEEDDGYLSALEIAALKLDADWVILSACNTAAGAATSAEALSGLARAFFYAQARALLVSHWEVYSDATVKLITTAIREMARDPKVGRAEALRQPRQQTNGLRTLIPLCKTAPEPLPTWEPGSRKKTLTVSAKRPEAVVMGVDQFLTCDGQLFDSPVLAPASP